MRPKAGCFQPCRRILLGLLPDLSSRHRSQTTDDDDPDRGNRAGPCRPASRPAGQGLSLRGGGDGSSRLRNRIVGDDCPAAGGQKRTGRRTLGEAQPGQIETNETTRGHLALSKSAGDFADLSSGRPYLVLRLATRCSDWAEQDMQGAVATLERSAMGLIDPPRERQVNNFCLFRYVRPVPPGAIE